MKTEPLEQTRESREMFLNMIPDPDWFDQQVARGEFKMIPDEGAASCKA